MFDQNQHGLLFYCEYIFIHGHQLSWLMQKYHCSVVPWFRGINVPSWSWSYGSWIYSYLCNQGLSPLTLWVRIPLRRGAQDRTLHDKVCQWLAAGQLFIPGTPVSSTNKTDRHDITEILLTVALSTIPPRDIKHCM